MINWLLGALTTVLSVPFACSWAAEKTACLWVSLSTLDSEGHEFAQLLNYLKALDLHLVEVIIKWLFIDS